MSAHGVEAVAGAAEIIGNTLTLFLIANNPSSPPEAKIHPVLQPGASSTLSRLGFGMGGRL